MQGHYAHLGVLFGGTGGARTRDHQIKSLVLYQLSYRPMWGVTKSPRLRLNSPSIIRLAPRRDVQPQGLTGRTAFSVSQPTLLLYHQLNKLFNLFFSLATRAHRGSIVSTWNLKNTEHLRW